MNDVLEKFEARFVDSQRDESIAVLGLADDPFEPTQYIILQRTLQPSQEDMDLKQDGVHLTVCGQHRSCYGGLCGIRVAANHVAFHFDAKTAEALEVSSPLRVDIHDANMDARTLAAELKILCGPYVDVQDASRDEA